MKYRFLSGSQLLAVSIIPQILFVQLISRYPDFVERFYSNCIYLFISRILRAIFGWIPFSMGDVFYTIAMISILYIVLRKYKFILKKPLKSFKIAMCLFSIGYFCFYSLWGFNYYRTPLYTKLHLSSEYSTSSLVGLTKNLANQANSSHLSITNNTERLVKFPYTREILLDKISECYLILSKKNPELDLRILSVKNSIYSTILSYMGYSGYINPFTNEAQINGQIPIAYTPLTICHEIAHQLGFSAENEANFIAYLATSCHHDPYIKYSAYSFALRYCLSELRKREPESFKEIYAQINPGILKSYEEQNDFWNQFENPIEPIIKITYSGYLKANHQQTGIQSYNYVVALLVNYHEKEKL